MTNAGCRLQTIVEFRLAMTPQARVEPSWPKDHSRKKEKELERINKLCQSSVGVEVIISD